MEMTDGRKRKINVPARPFLKMICELLNRLYDGKEVREVKGGLLQRKRRKRLKVLLIFLKIGVMPLPDGQSGGFLMPLSS